MSNENHKRADIGVPPQAAGYPTEAYWARFQNVLSALNDCNETETRLRTVMIYHMTDNPDLSKVSERSRHLSAAARRLAFALDAIAEQAEADNDKMSGRAAGKDSDV